MSPTAPWAQGRDEVQRSLERRELDTITGAAADGEALLVKAARTLRSATTVLADDPDTAYSLAYDAARFCGTALLAQQGLRPTTSGGHLVVVNVLRAQFGNRFPMLNTMRRRRNELEYPSGPGDETSPAEAQTAIDAAGEYLHAARQLLPVLGLYRTR